MSSERAKTDQREYDIQREKQNLATIQERIEAQTLRSIDAITGQKKYEVDLAKEISKRSIAELEYRLKTEREVTGREVEKTSQILKSRENNEALFLQQVKERLDRSVKELASSNSENIMEKLMGLQTVVSEISDRSYIIKNLSSINQALMYQLIKSTTSQQVDFIHKIYTGCNSNSDGTKIIADEQSSLLININRDIFSVIGGNLSLLLLDGMNKYNLLKFNKRGVLSGLKKLSSRANFTFNCLVAHYFLEKHSLIYSTSKYTGNAELMSSSIMRFYIKGTKSERVQIEQIARLNDLSFYKLDTFMSDLLVAVKANSLGSTYLKEVYIDPRLWPSGADSVIRPFGRTSRTLFQECFMLFNDEAYMDSNIFSVSPFIRYVPDFDMVR